MILAVHDSGSHPDGKLCSRQFDLHFVQQVFSMTNPAKETWNSGGPYEQYVGAESLREMMRVMRPGGKVAAYVWDYSGGMQMMRHFWDAAIEMNPDDAKLDEARRFPLCQPEPLTALFREVGLNSVAVRAIEIPTVFRDFDDYWLPFIGKQGAAPTYLASLDNARRDRIREALRARLAVSADGSISLMARAWAVRGRV